MRRTINAVTVIAAVICSIRGAILAVTATAHFVVATAIDEMSEQWCPHMSAPQLQIQHSLAHYSSGN